MPTHLLLNDDTLLVYSRSFVFLHHILTSSPCRDHDRRRRGQGCYLNGTVLARSGTLAPPLFTEAHGERVSSPCTGFLFSVYLLKGIDMPCHAPCLLAVALVVSSCGGLPASGCGWHLCRLCSDTRYVPGCNSVDCSAVFLVVAFFHSCACFAACGGGTLRSLGVWHSWVWVLWLALLRLYVVGDRSFVSGVCGRSGHPRWLVLPGAISVVGRCRSVCRFAVSARALCPKRLSIH